MLARQRDRARAELEDARAQLPAREEEYRQERLSNAHSEVRARLAEVDAVPRERPGQRVDRDPSESGQLNDFARSAAPPLPEGAVAWCACPACPLPVYTDEGHFCDLCWPVGCGCGCMCQCQCDPVERAPQRRRLEDAEHRQGARSHRPTSRRAGHASLQRVARAKARRMASEARESTALRPERLRRI